MVPIFRIRDRSKVLATVDFKELQTAYPFTLMIPQDRVEAILLRRLQSLGGGVERSVELTHIRRHDNEIEVELNDSGKPRTIRANWVIGCDGGHSLVREQAAIPFEGGAYEESFILADVEMDWPFGPRGGNAFLLRKRIDGGGPLPGNHFRIVATVPQAAPQPSLADFTTVLKERGPQDGPVSIRRMLWSSRFHIQHRVAKALRQGRILLAGDAAHVHSPAGGQGMNTPASRTLCHWRMRCINCSKAATPRRWTNGRRSV